GGESMEEWDEEGDQLQDDDFLLLFNADGGMIPFTLPSLDAGERWTVALDTHRPEISEGEEDVGAGESISLQGRSMVVLRRVARGV
ncbi:MAG: glycogen debranching enzyme, partial [Gemmatimonadota bacterium]|nr:glycogen debranching enzyme [Gemmatimonadota bacterium]